METKALVAREVTKTFRDGLEVVPVLEGVSLEVERGEIVLLEGPSGSGKTTFLSIAGCLLTATSGAVEIAGTKVDPRRPASLPAIRRQSIGFVFQQFNLVPSLTALENVQLAFNMKGIRGEAALDLAAKSLLAVDLEDRMDFLPCDLSGGQKQRVAVARSLAGDPALILADEPTANLDAASGSQVLELFRRLARREGRGLLIVTHDPRVRVIADRVLSMRDGQVAFERADLASGPRGGRRTLQELVDETRGWTRDDFRERLPGPFLVGSEHVYSFPGRRRDAAVTLGQSGSNDVIVFHAKVSARHATFARRPEGAWTIRDESTTGTRVSGQALLPNRPFFLRAGSVVDLGGAVRLTFAGPDELFAHLVKARRSVAELTAEVIERDVAGAFDAFVQGGVS